MGGSVLLSRGSATCSALAALSRPGGWHKTMPEAAGSSSKSPIIKFAQDVFAGTCGVALFLPQLVPLCTALQPLCQRRGCPLSRTQYCVVQYQSRCAWCRVRLRSRARLGACEAARLACSVNRGAPDPTGQYCRAALSQVASAVPRDAPLAMLLAHCVVITRLVLQGAAPSASERRVRVCRRYLSYPDRPPLRHHQSAAAKPELQQTHLQCALLPLSRRL